MWPCLTFVIIAQGTTIPGPFDVSSIQFGKPALVVELDTRQLHGELRRLAWAADGTLLYLQTAAREVPGDNQKVHHYTVALDGGVVTPIDVQPEWAASFWDLKQDRAAPGLPTLVIEVEQKLETIKSGTGPSGVLDRTGDPGSLAAAGPSAQNLADGAHGNVKAQVVRLRLVGREIAVFINEPKLVPGTRFSWGPDHSGALVFVGEKGELIFLDQAKHRRQVPDIKGAFLPAWSRDGSRLAYVQKTGRHTYSLAWVAVNR